MDGTVRIWDVFRSKKCVRVLHHDGSALESSFLSSIIYFRGLFPFYCYFFIY